MKALRRATATYYKDTVKRTGENKLIARREPV